jgi:DNA (cytosine-5)-methyltransferase 1
MTFPAQAAGRAIACVDLFCGAGGLTHGLQRAGVPVVAGVDLDETCKHPFEANNQARFYARDVASLTSEDLKEWWGDAEVRVLAGCAPCQPFSSYSQRYTSKKEDDQRYVRKDGQWGLLRHFARLVEETEPDVVTMENVPTVLKHEVFADFVSALERRGYRVWYDVVDSSAYGLPQRRRRTVLIASKLGEVRLRRATDAAPKTVKDALDGLPPLSQGEADVRDPLHAASRLSELNLQRVRASRPGGTWRDWPEQLVAHCHRKQSGRTYPGVYGRMSWSEPAPTLTTQFFGFGNGRFGHPEQDRALSLREGAILQGFPRNYSFIPPNGEVHFKALGRLIGNAVPVDLGRAIGESILDHLHANGAGKSWSAVEPA